MHLGGRAGRLAFLAALASVTLLLTAAALTRATRVAAGNAREVGRPEIAASPRAASPSPVADASSASAAATPSPALVVIGDGYARDAAWPQQVADQLRLQLINRSESGMGFHAVPAACRRTPCTSFAGAVDGLVGTDPAVIVFAGGQADQNTGIAAEASAAVTRARQRFPRARVLVLTPAGGQTPWPASLLRTAETLRSVAAGAGARYVDVGAVMQDEDSYANDDLTGPASTTIAGAVAAAGRA